MTTSIRNPSAPINAPAVFPGSSTAMSPAEILETFKPSNLQPSQHPALTGLMPGGFAEGPDALLAFRCARFADRIPRRAAAMAPAPQDNRDSPMSKFSTKPISPARWIACRNQERPRCRCQCDADRRPRQHQPSQRGPGRARTS